MEPYAGKHSDELVAMSVAMSGPSGSATPDSSGIATPDPCENYPPLLPHVLTDSEKIDCLMKQTQFLMKEHAEHFKVREFTKIWCTRDVVVCAAEIWKRSVLKHIGDAGDSDGRHLWAPNVQHFVQKAAIAMEMIKHVHQMKEMSRDCILAQNDAVHFESIKALDDAVKNSEKAIEMFPELKESHGKQCKTISSYKRFKIFLKDNFT